MHSRDLPGLAFTSVFVLQLVEAKAVTTRWGRKTVDLCVDAMHAMVFVRWALCLVICEQVCLSATMVVELFEYQGTPWVKTCGVSDKRAVYLQAVMCCYIVSYCVAVYSECDQHVKRIRMVKWLDGTTVPVKNCIDTLDGMSSLVTRRAEEASWKTQ